MNKLMAALLLLLAFSGWITSAIFIYQSKNNDNYVVKMLGENAFNIIEQSLSKSHSEAEVLTQIQQWKNDGWTAQTGSIATLCQYDRQRFKQWVAAKNLEQICE
ncbi:hypothetical protein [Photobacterium aquimaris]|uniref:Uncharacterized protein n=1 Tax=Photobacterium aquimaris TaxID=512643 RepID=A0A1Y6KVJ9_9GAMM|nr:hypothetical protein [Photobacterium aquimaris]SMY15097.1 hypothetical protein PAQU9191_00313 [Photobacterium aquimaris]